MGVNMKNYVVFAATSEDLPDKYKSDEMEDDLCDLHDSHKEGDISIIDTEDKVYFGLILGVSEDGREETMDFPLPIVFDHDKSEKYSIVDEVNNKFNTHFDADMFMYHVFTRYS